MLQVGDDSQPERDFRVIQQAGSWSTAPHRDSPHIPIELEGHEVPEVVDFAASYPLRRESLAHCGSDCTPHPVQSQPVHPQSIHRGYSHKPWTHQLVPLADVQTARLPILSQ